jgi:choline dehydrogenase-like flavoprotein
MSCNDDPVIVVGSGPTGATAAAELVRAGLPVEMLESGTIRPRGVIVRAAGNTVFRWTSSDGADTDRHRPSNSEAEWLSARALGGLSNYWTGSVPRFNPTDFDDGARIDERYRWPISYADLATYYERVEKVLEVTAGRSPAGIPAAHATHRQEVPGDWVRVIDRLANGQDDSTPLGLMPMAKGSPWMVALRATEYNSYARQVAPLLDSANFRLHTGCHVVRLERSSSDRFDTVVCIDRSGDERRLRFRAIVLAAGTIDSTEILLRTRTDDHPDGLGNNEGVLGAYLHDHPRLWSSIELTKDMCTLAHPLYLSRAPYDETPPMGGAGVTLGLAMQTDRVRSWFRRPVDRLGAVTFGTMLPRPEQSVCLDDPSTAAHPDESHLTIDASFADRDHATVDEAVERCAQLLGDGGVPVRSVTDTPRGVPGSAVHYGGTARMHSSREFGVVDADNSVHDAPEVLVSDAACFTTGPEKNPTLTAMAISMRAAELLAQRVA